MTPKNRAIEITLKYYKLGEHIYVPMSFAKECALIAVDEMLDYRNRLFFNEGSLAHQYLLEIKEEIKKL